MSSVPKKADKLNLSLFQPWYWSFVSHILTRQMSGMGGVIAMKHKTNLLIEY